MAMGKKNKSPYKDDFLNRIKAAHDLRPEDRLYSVMAMLKENLGHRFLRSQEIFEYAYDDPAGAEYWRGWFDKPGLTVEAFARLLATHTAAEYADNLGQEKPPRPIEMYSASREKIILTLREAAEMECLKFKGELDVLLGMRAGNEVSLGLAWITNSQGYSQPKTLDQVKVYPRQTIKWFADCPERAELLPESLRIWWATQSTMENMVEIAQDEEPDLESTIRTKPVLDPNQPQFNDIGDYWQVCFQGKPISLKKIKGLAMIAFLVSRPWETFKPEALLRLFSNPIVTVPEMPGDGYSKMIPPQPKCDAKTIKAVKDRLDELNNNPLPDPEKNMEEKEKLKKYLRDVAGLMGNGRTFRDDKERVRSSVDKAIRRTITSIKNNSPKLHQHLTQTILAKNLPRWSYHPNPIATKNI